MWMMLLHLHVKLNADDDDDDLRKLAFCKGGADQLCVYCTANQFLCF